MLYKVRHNGETYYINPEQIVADEEITLVSKTITNAYRFMKENNMNSIIYMFLGCAVQLEEIMVL